MPEPPILAYVEHCLPGGSVAARLRLAREHGLALEIANREGLDVDQVGRAGVLISTVQAWGMHDRHPLHRDPRTRRAAAVHVRETIEIAVHLGARRVLTVCGYGTHVVDAPLASCRAFFADLVPFARERGVRILVESLGRSRASAMTSPAEIERLLEQIGAPDVLGLAVDTGHIQDDGHDPAEVLARLRLPVEELQLRGRGSTPPWPAAPFRRWSTALRRPPAVIAVEHAQPLAPDDLEPLLRTVRAAWCRVSG